MNDHVKRIKHAAETSDTDFDAAHRLGLLNSEFTRMCRRLGIETPDKRRTKPRQT